jgi:hypothetical protein
MIYDDFHFNSALSSVQKGLSITTLLTAHVSEEVD